jgi:hypothetical protein
MSRDHLIERFLDQIRQFLDSNCGGVDIIERSDPPLCDESLDDSLSVSLRRESDTLRIPNIAFGFHHKKRRILPRVMELIQSHPSIRCVQFEGIKGGELLEANIEKHGYCLEDGGENATWHKR